MSLGWRTKIVGVPTPQSRIARNMKEAVACAEEIGYPVVMKVVSRDIIHKSDVGGLVLDLQNEKEVIEAYETIQYNCRMHKPDAHIEGMEVAEMLDRKVETIVGARQDEHVDDLVVLSDLGHESANLTAGIRLQTDRNHRP